jgi:cell division septum initiation protein DivIVA
MTTPPDSPIYDSETLVRRVIDMIATARTIPLSSSPVINRDEVLELLEEAVDRLPEELRRARWMLKERDEFIAKTRRQAEDILDEARAHAERMVQRTEVVRAAELRARQIVEAAENESRRMKMEVEDFCDQRLGSFEIVLDRLQKTVAAGREKLNLGARADEPELPQETGTNPAFFDQDRD